MPANVDASKNMNEFARPQLCLLEAEDLEAVAALEAITFSTGASASQYAVLLESGVCKLLGLKSAGFLIGYVAAVLVPAAGELEIYNIAVHPDFRKQGHGSELLGALLRIAREAGVSRAVLEVRESNAAALALYCSFGFTPCGRRKKYYGNPTEDALIYENIF